MMLEIFACLVVAAILLFGIFPSYFTFLQNHWRNVRVRHVVVVRWYTGEPGGTIDQVMVVGNKSLEALKVAHNITVVKLS